MSGLKTSFYIDGKKDPKLCFMSISYGYKTIDPETGKKHYWPIKLSTGKSYSTSDFQKYNQKNSSAISKIIATDLNRFEAAANATYMQFTGENNLFPTPAIFKETMLKRLGLIQEEKIEQTFLRFIDLQFVALLHFFNRVPGNFVTKGITK